MHTKDEALQLAAAAVDRMRREGAESELRTVEVRRFRDPAPPLFEASYFDRAQGLTDAEAHAARAHSWHAPVDNYNRRARANGSKYLMGYSIWPHEWGTQPTECPVCGTDTGDG